MLDVRLLALQRAFAGGSTKKACAELGKLAVVVVAGTGHAITRRDVLVILAATRETGRALGPTATLSATIAHDRSAAGSSAALLEAEVSRQPLTEDPQRHAGAGDPQIGADRHVERQRLAGEHELLGDVAVGAVDDQLERAGERELVGERPGIENATSPLRRPANPPVVAPLAGSSTNMPSPVKVTTPPRWSSTSLIAMRTIFSATAPGGACGLSGSDTCSKPKLPWSD